MLDKGKKSRDNLQPQWETLGSETFLSEPEHAQTLFKMSSYRGSQYLEFLYIYQNLDIEIRSG